MHCLRASCINSHVLAGSLDSEAGILCSTFDRSGSRLIVGEADKSIKIYKEDMSSVRHMTWHCIILRHTHHADARDASSRVAAKPHPPEEVLESSFRACKCHNNDRDVSSCARAADGVLRPQQPVPQ